MIDSSTQKPQKVTQKQSDAEKNMPQGSNYSLNPSSNVNEKWDQICRGFSEQNIKDFQAVIPTNEDKPKPLTKQLHNAANVIDVIEKLYDVPQSERLVRDESY